MILAVPNVAEGRDFERIGRLVEVLEYGPVELLDWSSDLDHNRAVFSLSGGGPDLVNSVTQLAGILAGGAGIEEWQGVHPTVGVLDVAPFVWIGPEGREEAEAAAADAGRRLGEAGIPVFLYGAMATSPDRRERSWFRRGGEVALRSRMESGELRPDFGPTAPHPVMGATLVTARPPLVAFNVELEGGDPGAADRIASIIRESGGGAKGLRAIGLELSTGRSQVSMNVEEPGEGSLGEIVRRIRPLAEAEGASVIEAELIGMTPEVALEDFPEEVPIRNFDPDRQVIERRLGHSGGGGGETA